MTDDGKRTSTFSCPEFVVELDGERTQYDAIGEGDWIFVCSISIKVERVARGMRVRSDLHRTTLQGDKLAVLPVSMPQADLSIMLTATGAISSLHWSTFVDVLLVGHQAYIQELLQLPVIDDLLGPAHGPQEQILDISVRDRDVVGKLLSFGWAD